MRRHTRPLPRPRSLTAAASVRAIRGASSRRSRCRTSSSTSSRCSDRHAQRRHARGLLARLSGVARLRRQDPARVGLQPEGHAVQLSVLAGEQAARPEQGHADAEDLPARQGGRLRPADGGLHHDGQLADGRADERPGVPGRRDRRPAHRRLGSRLRGRRLHGRVRQGRARPARHVPVRRQVGSWRRPPAPPA